MCSPAAPQGSADFFHPHVKCCSYEPALPNFLVGRIVRDSAPEWQFGRDTVAQRIVRGHGVRPWGLHAARRHGVLYGSGHRLFGRSPDLRCSHYHAETDSCGIWPHRNGVCATWFCKHERGATGLRFWSALSALVTEVEWSLGVWCVEQLGGSPAELERMTRRTADELTPSDLGAPLDDRAYRLAWGPWAGREAEFYTRAAALVDPLDWPAIERISGVRARVHATLVREASRALETDQVPERSAMRPLRIMRAGQGTFTVESYSGYDPVAMPEVLMRALRYFDGRLTAETLDEIRQQLGTTLTPALVRKLLDFELIAGVPDEPESGAAASS